MHWLQASYCQDKNTSLTYINAPHALPKMKLVTTNLQLHWLLGKPNNLYSILAHYLKHGWWCGVVVLFYFIFCVIFLVQLDIPFWSHNGKHHKHKIRGAIDLIVLNIYSHIN